MSDGADTLRLGLYGGTFDPPHLGHLLSALRFHAALDLDRLIVMPSADPPHRDVELSAEVRYDLVRRLFAGEGRFEVARDELDREGPSYAVETLERLRGEHASAEIFLCIGTDQYRAFGDWHRSERIEELATLAVLEREGEKPGKGGATDGAIFLDGHGLGLSSTEIRQRLDDGASLRGLVPEAIRARVIRAWASRTSRSVRAR